MWLDREAEINPLVYSPFAELITNIATRQTAVEGVLYAGHIKL